MKIDVNLQFIPKGHMSNTSLTTLNIQFNINNKFYSIFVFFYTTT